MSLPKRLRQLRPRIVPPARVRPAPPPGRTGVAIEWTPVRKRVARKVQARGDKTLLARFMQKWSREDG